MFVPWFLRINGGALACVGRLLCFVCRRIRLILDNVQGRGVGGVARKTCQSMGKCAGFPLCLSLCVLRVCLLFKTTEVIVWFVLDVRVPKKLLLPDLGGVGLSYQWWVELGA